jgi:hypothetical protein
MINSVTEKRTRYGKRKRESVRASKTHDEAKRRCRKGSRNWILEALQDSKAKERYIKNRWRAT